MTYWGIPKNVRTLLGRGENDLQDSDIVPFLEYATRYLKSQYGARLVSDMFNAVATRLGGASKVYDTFFPIDESHAIKVYVNGNEVSASVVDGLVEIDADVHVRDRIVIYYKPDFFDDYVEHLSAKRMIDTSFIDVPQGSESPQYNHLRNSIKDYNNQMKRKKSFGKFRDHNDEGSVY